MVVSLSLAANWAAETRTGKSSESLVRYFRMLQDSISR
ncbi:Uncharacterised protein [Mycobacteroides abscessus subsp. abscessus]|nr:Uncharacterised protein [Mycobacteroides abscessus subsp. abscessus]